MDSKNKNKIYLASNSKVKSEAVKEVFVNSEEWEVINHASESKVSEQPLSYSEIREGATNRLENTPYTPCISIETGIVKRNDGYFDVSLVLLRTNLGIYEEWSSLTPIPENLFLEWKETKEKTFGKYISKLHNQEEKHDDWYSLLSYPSRKSVLTLAVKAVIERWSLTKIPFLEASVISYKNVEFLDIQDTLLHSSRNLSLVTRRLADNLLFDSVLVLDARGFLLCGEFQRENYPIVLARKSNKLPKETVSVEYKKEYGTDTLCVEKQAIPKNSRVIVIDDLTATGGSLKAAESLVNKCDSKVIAFITPFVIENEDGLLCKDASIISRLRYAYTQKETSKQKLPLQSSLPVIPSNYYYMALIAPPSLQSLCLGAEIIPVQWNNFRRSSNLWVDFSKVKNRDIYVLLDPSNYKETEDVLSIVKILKRKKVNSITIIIPFLEQATQDRIERKGDFESIAEVDTLSKKIGNFSVITFDIHCLQSVFAYYDLTNESLIEEMWRYYSVTYPESIVVFPDEGASKRFSYIFSEAKTVTYRKKRDGNKRIVHTDDEIVSNATYVIVDDLVRSGGTMHAVAKHLLENKAERVDCMFAHAPLEPSAARNMEIFTEIWTSDSCPQSVPSSWVKINVIPFLAEKLNLKYRLTLSFA